MQWGRFVCPSCYQKRKNPIFELIYKALGDFQVPVSNLLEVVLHVKKAATFGVQKVNGGQDICSRDLLLLLLHKYFTITITITG